VHDERIDELVRELDRVQEGIADLALDLLHQAMSDADPKASPSAKAEKIVTRARRSVEKARHLLVTLDRERLDED
jgi:hypothetical protein